MSAPDLTPEEQLLVDIFGIHDEESEAEADAYQLAMFMQARDAQRFGAVIEGMLHPTWVETGPDAAEEYVADAAAYLNATRVLGYRKAGVS